MNMQEIVAEMSNTNSPKNVTLNDTICVGCGNCGSCCMNTQTKLNAFDIYNMAKKVGTKDISKYVSFYIGDNSRLPVAGLFSSNETGMCPFLKVTNEGDYECTLEECKPITCTHPFIAIGTAFTNKEFSFIPIDEQVPSFDIDTYLNNCDINSSTFYYLEDHSNSCPSKCKKDMLVSEYMSDRIKYSKEYTIASVISMLICRYIKVPEFERLLYLADNSKENNPIVSTFGGTNSYDRLMKSMFTNTYLYMDIESPKSFIEQSIDHIKYLESKTYPLFRILYKYLYIVFDPGHVTLESILNTKDEKLAQERFDNYFSSNVEQIRKRFYEKIIAEMTMEIAKLNV